MFDFVKDVKITLVSTGTAAGTTDIDSDRVDMTDFDSVCFVWQLGDVDNTAVVSALLKSNAADSTTGSTTEITGTSTTATATSADDKLIIVNCHRPTHRYAYSTLDRGTANAVLDGCVAYQYNASSLPVTQGSTVLTSNTGITL